jgi:hypothetical protein
MASHTDSGQSAGFQQNISGSPHYRHYHPLNGARREIRVLDLVDKSECVLHHVSLNDDPEFFALSYYWGPPTSTRPFSVRETGGVMPASDVLIRRTVADFLSNLYVLYGQITVWLDVMCIDQRNVDEQSAQVAMMGEIYQRAQGVYAWMGGWDPDMEYFFEHCTAMIGGTTNTTPDGERLRASANLLSLRPYWTR